MKKCINQKLQLIHKPIIIIIVNNQLFSISQEIDSTINNSELNIIECKFNLIKCMYSQIILQHHSLNELVELIQTCIDELEKVSNDYRFIQFISECLFNK